MGSCVHTFGIIAVSMVIFCSIQLSVVEAQTTLAPNQGKGTKFCNKCGQKSNVPDFKDTEISRCTVVNISKTNVEKESIFACECLTPHFIGDGFECNNFDECTNHKDNCDNHAECIDTSRGFNCTCKPGYTGDGVNCTNINECDGNPCHVNGTEGGQCIDKDGSYDCQCYDGKVEGKGLFTNTADSEGNSRCDDVNECHKGSHSCEEFCVNTVGSYRCKCMGGHEPLDPAKPGKYCIDVNECRGTSNVCGDKNRCSNLDPETSGQKYRCECENGYKLKDGQDPDGDCGDIDECEDKSNVCYNELKHTRCNNTLGSYDCVCAEGWFGDASNCQDINECDMTNKCHQNASCTNTQGNYTCTCNAGFKGNGYSCKDTNECQEKTDNCNDQFANCENTVGNYTCSCIHGFTGDGVTCTEINSNLEGVAKNLTRVQMVLKYHSLVTELKLLQNKYDQLLKRCALQEKARSRSRRAVLSFNADVLDSYEKKILAIEKFIAELKLHNLTLESLCPKKPSSS